MNGFEDIQRILQGRNDRLEFRLDSKSYSIRIQSWASLIQSMPWENMSTDKTGGGKMLFSLISPIVGWLSLLEESKGVFT